MTRYVAVPVQIDSNGDDGYLAWVEPHKMIDEGRCDLETMGHGSTEDEAFSDLLAKLGYEEAYKSPAIDYIVNGDAPHFEAHFDPFSCDDPWHPCDSNGYEVNEIEFEEMYGMSVGDYMEECKRRGVPHVRNEK